MIKIAFRVHFSTKHLQLLSMQFFFCLLTMSPLLHIFHYGATSKTLNSCSSFQWNFFLFVGNKGDIVNFFLQFLSVCSCTFFGQRSGNVSLASYILHYVATSKTLYFYSSFQCNFFLFAGNVSLASYIS